MRFANKYIEPISGSVCVFVLFFGFLGGFCILFFGVFNVFFFCMCVHVYVRQNEKRSIDASVIHSILAYKDYLQQYQAKNT